MRPALGGRWPRRPPGRSTLCQQATCGARMPTLLRCTGPRKCQRTAAGARRPPWPPVPGRSSRRCPTTRPRWRRDRLGPEALGHCHHLDHGRVAPGPGDAALGPRPAGSPLRRGRSRWPSRAGPAGRGPGSRSSGPSGRWSSPPHHGGLAWSVPAARQDQCSGEHAVHTPVSPASVAPARSRLRRHRGRQVERRGRRRGHVGPHARAEAGGAARRGRPRRTGSTPGGCRARARASTRWRPGARMASTVASMTPASRPRQPAWATPITPSALAQGDRRAVGGQDRQRHPRRPAHRGVGRRSASPARVVDQHDPWPVDLDQPGPRPVDDGPAAGPPPPGRSRSDRPGRHRPGPSPANSRRPDRARAPVRYLRKDGTSKSSSSAKSMFSSSRPPSERGRGLRVRIRRPLDSSQRSKPAAITVTRTSSPMASSMT